MNIEAYAKKIFGFALSKTNNFHNAEDLTQEILMALYNSSEKIHKVENLDAYVYKICLYTWSNYIRREKRHWRNLSIEESYSLHEYNEIDDIVEEDERNRILLLLRKEIAFMNKLYREILVKKYFEKKTIKEISRELYISEGTIKWYIHDAKKKLKEEIRVNSGGNLESYRPIRLRVGHSGSPGANNEPEIYFSSLLNQNIAYLTYKTPLSIEEISRKLQVAAVFVEEAIEVLEDAELIRKVGKKYQTAFIINDAELIRERNNIKRKKSEEVALCIYEAIHDSFEEIRKVGFLGNHLSENILMWTIYPYYINNILYETEDFKELNNYVPTEKKDGGKYIALGNIVQDENQFHGEEAKIYERYETKGLKTRERENFLFSYQIDFYFQGLEWREFNIEDAVNLSRIAEGVKNNAHFNEFEKVIISNYVKKGYLGVKDEKVEFKFPMFTKKELGELDSIIMKQFEKINILERLNGYTREMHKCYRKKLSKWIDENTIGVASKGAVTSISIGCMEYLERIGKLKIPSNEEQKSMTTLIWYDLGGIK